MSSQDAQNQEPNISQSMENKLGNVELQGDRASFTFAPVQIGTKVETQIIQISAERVTQRSLNKSSPYKGLKRYNFRDRDIFFGRDALISKLVTAVNKNKLLLVLGASGCGKSSVVRAGLIPELKKNLGETQLLDFVFSPGQNPFDSLHRCLLSEDKDYSFSESEAEIALKSHPHTLVEVIQSLKPKNTRWIIFIDQFEEIFTNCTDEQRRLNFIDSIVELNQVPEESVRVVLAMRADFLEYFSSYPQLGSLVNNNNIHLVTDMHPDELRLAIEQPAARHGVVFEEGLVEHIIKEVQGQNGYLPLLQYTLNLLWKTECRTEAQDNKFHIDDRTLNRSSYMALEGVRGALQTRINNLYQKLNQEEQDATRQIFLRLVQVEKSDFGTRAVSRKAHRSDFQGKSVESTLKKFVDENMIVSDYDYAQQNSLLAGEIVNLPKNAVFEIAHEIILSSWEQLRQWLKDAEDSIIFKNLLADDIARWQSALAKLPEQGGASSEIANEELLKGSRLDRALQLREHDAFALLGGLTDLENEFVDKSLAWQTRQRKRQADLEIAQERNQLLSDANKQARKTIRSSLAVLAVVIPVAIGASWAASRAIRRASVAAKGVKLEQAGVSAIRQFRSGEIDALLSAVYAGKELQTLVNAQTPIDTYPAVSPILALQKISASIYEKNRLAVDQEEIRAADISADSQYIVTGGKDGTIQISQFSGEKVTTFQAHEGNFRNIYGVSFSPDGQFIASASRDSSAKLWTITGQAVTTFSNHKGELLSVDFSPDGQRLVTTSSRGEVMIWDTSGQQLAQLEGHQGRVHDVAFSPDGKQLATAGADGTIRVWEAGGNARAQWEGHQGQPVVSVSFSSNGQKLISGGGDKTAKVWDLSGQEQLILEGHRLLVTDASFSPDDQQLATASDDGTARLWNLKGEEMANFQGHRGVVWRAEFSPNGDAVLTTGRDGTARLWSLQNAALPRFEGLQKDANTVAISPDGKTVAAGGDEGILTLWEASSGELKQSWSAKAGPIYSTAFSPDGKLIATAGGAGSFNVWDLSGNQQLVLRGHSGFINSLSFSPDGKFMATAGADKLARLWTTDGSEVTQFKSHEDVVSAVAFTPDSSTVVTAGWDGQIKLWEPSGELLKEWKGHSDKISGLDFSTDGKVMATADKGGTVIFWDMNGQKQLEFFTYQSGVNALKFIPHTSLIVTGGMDGTTRVWDMAGRQVNEFTHQNGPVWGVATSSDAQRIIAAGTLGEVHQWELVNLTEGIRQGCTWLNSLLSNTANQDLQSACQN
ncbi:MAG: hypothetical protein AAF703_08495 [Cyanobacteria bacterium P01_D01_bin.105]